jgi:hypothetical protein
VRLTEPLEGASVSGIITISATAADADGTVRRVRFGLPNGSAFDDETAPYSITFDTTTVTNGPAQLSAIALRQRGARQHGRVRRHYHHQRRRGGGRRRAG